MVRRRLLGRILRSLSVLSSFHFGLLQQPLLFRQPLSFLAVFDLILANQSLRWTAKDTLVFTEFTNPNVPHARGVVQVGILLLDLSLARRQSINTPGRPLLLPARISWSTTGCLMRLLLRPSISLLGSHAWTGLRPLRIKPSCIVAHGSERRRGRTITDGEIVLCLQCHSLGRIRFTRKRKLGLRRRRGGVLLVEQTAIVRASGGRGDRGSIGDSS